MSEDSGPDSEGLSSLAGGDAQLLTQELMNLGFQRRTDLAVRALRYLRMSGAKMSGAALSSSIGTTTSFLPQVMAPLIERGWIASERGPGGGYFLTMAAAKVSLFDVVEATEGPSVDGRCVLLDQSCPGEAACLAHEVWSTARDGLFDGLRKIPVIPDQGEGNDANHPT